jgi:hypothetical protein
VTDLCSESKGNERLGHVSGQRRKVEDHKRLALHHKTREGDVSQDVSTAAGRVE